MALPIHRNGERNIRGRGFQVNILVLVVLVQPQLAMDLIDQENPNHSANGLRQFKS